MTLSPGARKLALTVHVTCSVGWLGAVAAFLALAITCLVSQDPQRVRAVYVAMGLIGWFVIVPLCLASLLSGLVSALGTTWGLFRHYWVLIKLLLTTLATVALLVHMRPISAAATTAAGTTFTGAELGGTRLQLAGDAVAAMVVLFVATALSIYKPRGMTRYGRREQL